METADGVRSIDGTSINDLSDRPPAPDTPPTLVGVPSDRCSNCGAELAVDQRYCVQCGQRRGKPRFNLATPTPTAPEPAPAVSRKASRVSSGTALLAGLATLLLALGVGVLIGHSGSSSGRQPVNVKITDSGVGGLPAAGSTVSGSTARGSSKHKASAKAPSKPVATKIVAPKKLQKAVALAKKHVISNAGQNVIGGKCAAGTSGCQNGKNTGNFFH